MTKHHYSEVRKIINELLKSGQVIPKQQIIDLARNEGLDEEDIREAIKHFIQEGTLLKIDGTSFQVPV